MGARQFDFQGKLKDVYVWHRDQVTSAPPEAHVTATAGYCAVGTRPYNFPAASVQFHPEYTELHLRKMFKLASGYFLTTEDVNVAIASFKNVETDGKLFADEAADFLQLHS